MTDNTPVVPFVVRGVSYPDGDMLYDNGRIRFRYPDPRKIPDLVADGIQLRQDFAKVKVSEIIRFLAEAGGRMTLKNPAMQRAMDFSAQYSALTPSVVRGSFELIPVVFSSIALRAMVENEIGSKYLDGWVHMPYSEKWSRTHAYGMRTLQFISGNVPVVAALSIARTALIKSDNLVKVSVNDPFTSQAILGAMVEVDPKHPVTRHFAAIYWPNDMTDFEKRLISGQNFEKIISWGGAMGGVNSTMSHSDLSAAGVDIIALGAKFSVAMIGREAFETEQKMDQVAKLVAKDTFSFNMQSCGSTRFHFIEATPEQSRKYADRLAHYMHFQPPSLSTPAPRNMPMEVREVIDLLRYDDENYYVAGGKEGAGSVVVSMLPGEPADFFPVDNNVSVVRVDRLEDAIQLLAPSVQTISIYPEKRRAGLRDMLVAKGAARFISPGHTIDYSVGGPFNHTEIMRRACRWVLDESYPPAWAYPLFGLQKLYDIATHHLFK